MARDANTIIAGRRCTKTAARNVSVRGLSMKILGSWRNIFKLKRALGVRKIPR